MEKIKMIKKYTTQEEWDKRLEESLGETNNDVWESQDFINYLKKGLSLCEWVQNNSSKNYSVSTVVSTEVFEDNFKLLIKKNKKNTIKKLIKIIEELLDFKVTSQYKNHPLKNYNKHKELHIDGDTLLIYKYQREDVLIVELKLSAVTNHKGLNFKKDDILNSPEHKEDASKFIDNLKKEAELEESFEIHDTLNPKIFNLETDQMHPEVKEALLNIAKLFIDGLEENKIPLNIVDYHLLGSNAAYNYNKDSDLDVHIIVDIRSLNMDNYNIIANLYNYAKSNFNNKYEFIVKGHPVEIYLEDITLPAKSNGVYSLLNDEWVKIPEKQEPRVINIEETELYKQLENDYNNITPYEAMDFLDRLYAIRQHSLTTEGEYGDGNLVFKEFRNRGYIDNIKDMIIKLREKNLSLQN